LERQRQRRTAEGAEAEQLELIAARVELIARRRRDGRERVAQVVGGLADDVVAEAGDGALDVAAYLGTRRGQGRVAIVRDDRVANRADRAAAAAETLRPVGRDAGGEVVRDGAVDDDQRPFALDAAVEQERLIVGDGGVGQRE